MGSEAKKPGWRVRPGEGRESVVAVSEDGPVNLGTEDTAALHVR